MCFLIVEFLCLVRVNAAIYSSTTGKDIKIKLIFSLDGVFLYCDLWIFIFGIYGIRMCFSIVVFLRLVRVNAAIYSSTTGKGTKNKTRLRLERLFFVPVFRFWRH